ncbi:MAG: zf-HC2 domain-containing protein [Gemmatimonadaceae bacterium]
MTTPTMNLDCDGFADALADYLEGDASDGVRSAVEAHASTCAACQQLLADLTSIRTASESLPLLTPSRDLWTGIAERIDARIIPMEAPRIARDIPRRRLWLRPAVAAAALVVVTAGTTYVLTRAQFAGTQPERVAVVAPAVTPPVTPAEPTAEFISTATERPDPVAPVKRTPAATAPAVRLVSAKPAMGAADPVFAREISKLRRIVRDRRSQLDPKTVAVLEQSIAVIDSAIAQSRAALAKDPASGFLATQLNHSLEKKVELLRTAALLPSRTLGT